MMKDTMGIMLINFIMIMVIKFTLMKNMLVMIVIKFTMIKNMMMVILINFTMMKNMIIYADQVNHDQECDDDDCG